MSWNKKHNPNIFPGWPTTKCNQKKREVRIRATYLTPEGAEWRDGISGLLTIATITLGFMNAETMALGWTHALAGFLSLIGIHYIVLPFILSARVWIVFSEDHIRVRTMFSLWKQYERGRDGYGFKHMPHKKGQDEIYAVGKKGKNYFINSHQIYINHYQGFLMLPGIYGWEKSIQLYNRMMGVEMWVGNLMPRIWGHRPDYNHEILPKKKGIGMKLVRKLSYLVFYIVAFCLLGFSFLLICGTLGKAIEIFFSPEAKAWLVQILSNVHPLIIQLILTGLLIGGLKQIKKIADSWDRKVFEKKQSEDDVIDAEFFDLGEEEGTQKRVNPFLLKAMTCIAVIIFLLIGDVVVFQFFEISQQDINQKIATPIKVLN